MFFQKQTGFQKLFIYTDASFNASESLAVSGFLFFDNEASNTSNEVLETSIETYSFKVKNNIRAEIMGANYCLKKINDEIKLKEIDIKSLEINLYSDCQTLTDLLMRRDKLLAKNFISGKKKTELANADLYKEFYAIYDLVKPKIHWVKGHSKSEGQSVIQKNFQIIDQKVRKELRLLI
ncbi:MAG: RNase H family protein [Pseudobdellovibrio sp.]